MNTIVAFLTLNLLSLLFMQTPHAAARSPSFFFYSVEAGPTHSIFLSNYVDYMPGSAQAAWFEADLAAVNRSVTPWITVNFHNPWRAAPSCSLPDLAACATRCLAALACTPAARLCLHAPNTLCRSFDVVGCTVQGLTSCWVHEHLLGADH